MSTTATELDANPYFEPLGFSDDDFFVRLKSSGSVVRFVGQPDNWALAWIAPM